jgi:NADH:ubiquinone oxidoreductase subunit F (NADH-binding)
LCALGEFATMAVVSSIERFKADFEQQVPHPEPEAAAAD